MMKKKIPPLKSRNLSEEKKPNPEHKYSVTFVSKVGTIKIMYSSSSKVYAQSSEKSEQIFVHF